MNFYKDLEPIRRPIKDVLAEQKLFTNFPDNWHVVVADIVNSTQAVKTGKHDDVNLIAAGSLIAAINAAKPFNTEIAYFFGGDGGTVIVPDEIVNKILSGLNAHKINSLKNFSLELRVGSITIGEIIKAGHELKVAKVEIGKGYNKSVVIGNGLKYAENIIKDNYLQDKESIEHQLLTIDSSELNLEGLECRWDRIKPLTSSLEVVCLLIEAVNFKNQSTVYRDVMIKLDEIYGEADKRHPITMNRLQLLTTFLKFKKEMMVRYSKWKIGHFLKAFFETLIGRLYFKYNWKVNDLKGQEYLEQVIAFSDTLTIDGRINTIVSGTKENRLRLLEYLNQQEQKGLLIFGHFVSTESIMTCYIENRNDKHIHFLDGSNGGYTEAAKELKPKLQML
ncbi:MAG: DUF3095 domain-containing protein [Chitinophagaceae bacterium]|nr:DUF3095 domain-containing protein [Chitinophagaceae bacterium]